jgi:hypothetical protein
MKRWKNWSAYIWAVVVEADQQRQGRHQACGKGSRLAGGGLIPAQHLVNFDSRYIVFLTNRGVMLEDCADAPLLS